MARVLTLGLPLLLALVTITTWTVVGRALRPVAAISAEVRSITDAELDLRQPVDLDDVALGEARRVRTQGRVQVDATAVHAARVSGDPVQLACTVRNLVDNAARHATGRVTLAVDLEGDHAVLRVDDDGPGVAVGDRERVFERFTRLDNARARAEGGSGLGLAIVAQLVERHGGTVRCLAAPGGGARFEVRLPAVEID